MSKKTMTEQKTRKLSQNQKYKKNLKRLIRRAQIGDEVAKSKVLHEYQSNPLAKWVVKHLKKINSKKLKEKSSLTKKAKERTLSPEQEALSLRVQSRGFGDGVHIPHSHITKHGKNKQKK